MKPNEFIDSLLRHYAKRHQSEAHEAAWLKEMVECAKNTHPRVLRRAYETILNEWDERAFPLPAELKKFIARAAEQIYPEGRGAHGQPSDKPNRWSNISLRSPDTPQQIAQWQDANRWQQSIMAKYKTWANYWKQTKHLHPGGDGKTKTFREPEPMAVPDRTYFASKPNWNAGTLSDITKRMTGERE
jgi:hypothetical protein